MMKAREIKAGDRYNGATGYTVQEVWHAHDRDGDWVHARVRYDVDSGEGKRTWLANDRVPLDRP